MICRSLTCLLAVLAAFSPPARATLVPGALPAHRFAYADSWRGWPLGPTYSQHPIRGSFLDPRYPNGQYHWGVDINVRDDRPERGAPAGRSHRVYAVEGGVVRNAADAPGLGCSSRHLSIAHFAYWHADATVRVGQRVRPGQMIGWTCMGEWHLHLSEWTTVRGQRVWINPLHRGGKLRPYVDTAPPVIPEISFYSPSVAPAVGRRLDPETLRGRVDVRAQISDPQSFRGWMVGRMGLLHADHHPYEVRVTLTRVSGGRSWSWTLFRGDVWLGSRVAAVGTPRPFARHFAPRTFPHLKTRVCLQRQTYAPTACAGRYRLRLFGTTASPVRMSRPYWDTRLFPNGRYRIRVRAFDLVGNSTSAIATATVAN